ncbi:hypothetical protein KA005_72440, partial [bacterium]|nr:hypothetical protein [bacterium]
MDEATSREIEKVTWNTLRDAGIVRPPVQIELILQHLHLYRDFYSLKNPSFLDRTKHKIRVHGTKLVNILQKINLMAVLFYDENRIVVDEELPEIRQDWPSFHEVSHKIFVWHKPYFYGDTAQTLDPDWHEVLESEANYGASELMFCGPAFRKDALDTTKDWAGVIILKELYEKSMTTTLRRFVEHGPDHPMVMLVSTPCWKTKPVDQPEWWRYFVRSKKFVEKFRNVKPEQVLHALDNNCDMRRGGPVADFIFSLNDDNGESHEFHAESFYNTHDILTFCV